MLGIRTPEADICQNSCTLNPKPFWVPLHPFLAGLAEESHGKEVRVAGAGVVQGNDLKSDGLGHCLLRFRVARFFALNSSKHCRPTSYIPTFREESLQDPKSQKFSQFGKAPGQRGWLALLVHMLLHSKTSQSQLPCGSRRHGTWSGDCNDRLCPFVMEDLRAQCSCRVATHS